MKHDAAFADRRARVLAALAQDGALILSAAPELRIGWDSELRYAPDPDLYYLTGYAEPEAVLVLSPSFEEAPFTLFVRPRDPERELWTGVRGGIEAALERFGADAAHPIEELPDRLPKIVARAERLCARLNAGVRMLDELLLDILARARHSRARTGAGPRTVTDPGALLQEMRLRKDAGEVESLREAARVSVESFRDAVRRIRPGAGEWIIEAALEAGFRERGASGPAFPTIVASGPNATVLHYIENGRTMQDGELVLLDAGARRDMYCADISRTLPVSGAFSPEQAVLYDGVLAAHDAAVAAVRPGATIRDVHEAALRPLLCVLAELGILEVPIEEALEKEDAYKRFYPHRTSHWLGLDVHDVGDYVVAGEPRRLEPGMVLTIEPGLYLPPDTERAPARLRGAGVRIEDDVLVTREGREVLTAGLPARRNELCDLVGAA